MRTWGLWTGAAALIVITPMVLGAGSARAQTMGEYGTTVAQSGTLGQSASTLRPPEAYVNPISGGGGSSRTIEVNSERRVDDSSTDREDRDSRDNNSGDEWSISH